MGVTERVLLSQDPELMGGNIRIGAFCSHCKGQGLGSTTLVKRTTSLPSFLKVVKGMANAHDSERHGGNGEIHIETIKYASEEEISDIHLQQ